METQPANTSQVDEFFADMPSSPSMLLTSRKSLLVSTDIVDKIDEKARQARESENHSVAAIASWLTGDYTNAVSSALQLDAKAAMTTFILGSSYIELDKRDPAAEVLEGLHATSDLALNA
ncbi:MAG TPA: hypothetical protein EYQ77_07845, partial [Methylococcaceae bacterium]|nr:hypothetical protein [Methylococcaceae bacterium]